MKGGRLWPRRWVGRHCRRATATPATLTAQSHGACAGRPPPCPSPCSCTRRLKHGLSASGRSFTIATAVPRWQFGCRNGRHRWRLQRGQRHPPPGPSHRHSCTPPGHSATQRSLLSCSLKDSRPTGRTPSHHLHRLRAALSLTLFSIASIDGQGRAHWVHHVFQPSCQRCLKMGATKPALLARMRQSCSAGGTASVASAGGDGYREMWGESGRSGEAKQQHGKLQRQPRPALTWAEGADALWHDAVGLIADDIRCALPECLSILVNDFHCQGGAAQRDAAWHKTRIKGGLSSRALCAHLGRPPTREVLGSSNHGEAQEAADEGRRLDGQGQRQQEDLGAAEERRAHAHGAHERVGWVGVSMGGQWTHFSTLSMGRWCQPRSRRCARAAGGREASAAPPACPGWPSQPGPSAPRRRGSG